MHINMFVTRERPLETLIVKAYSIDRTIPPDDYYRITKGAEWKLFNNNLPATTYGDKLYFVGNGKDPFREFEINNYKFTLTDQDIKLNAKEHTILLSQLVESTFKQKVFSLGFERPEGQKFYNKIPYKEDFFSFYDAFYSEVEVFHNGTVGIWFDPTTKWKYKMNALLQWARNTNFDELNNYLLKKKVKCPSVSKYRYFTGKIVDIIDIPIQEYTFEDQNGKKISVYEYWITSEPHAKWLRKNQVKLDPNEHPTVMIEIAKNTRRLIYPPSVLELVIDLLDPIIPDSVFFEKKSLSPKIRIKETLELFDLILGNGLKLGTTRLEFEKRLFNLNANNSNLGKLIYLQAPILKFGHDGICKPDKPWSDPPIKNSMFQYGPVDVKNSIPINYIAPESEIDNLKQFHDYLNKHAKKLHLGEFKFNSAYPVDRIHPDRYMRICQKFGQEITNQIAIVILPKTNPTKTYYAAKRGLGRNLVISEMIQWRTYNKLLNASIKGEFSFTNYNIALKAYGRHLECGEAIWHLQNPAGGLNPDQNNYFMGFDVSRNPETRKEAAAYAAVCDNLGRILYKNSIDTHRGEKVIAEVLSDWFFDLATCTYDNIGNDKKVDTIFLFKDGPIYRTEVNEYQKGALLAKERLIQERIMHESSDIKVIAAIKRGLHRFYGEERYSYRVNYSGLIRSPNEAIIVTSRPRIGTASTTRLNLVYQINSNMDIEQIVKIFNDLRYLDWSSLFQQPKTILPLHIVQNLAKLTKEDIIVPYDPR